MCADLYDEEELTLNYKDDCSDSSDEKSCYDSTSPNAACFRENIMFDTLNAIVDRDFSNSHKAARSKVIIAYDEWDADFLKDVHKNLSGMMSSKKSFGDAVIAGYKSGDKMEIFNSQLFVDNLLAIGAFLSVLGILWFHSGSAFIASFGLLQIFLNLGVAYGIYMGVLFLPFFPFLNLVSIFVVVGIGADDIFVFMDAWKQSAQVMGDNAPLDERMSAVIHKACGSIFITSLTTASAFAANAFSIITCLKCFGTYCAIVIVVDFVLMLTYVPALVIIYETSVKERCCKSSSSGGCCSSPPVRVGHEVAGVTERLRPVEKFFKDRVAPFVIRGKWLLLVIFGSFAVFMGYKSSQISRPTTTVFQLFKSTHPMEKYDLELQDRFYLGSSDSSSSGMSIKFIFGVKGKDNGNHWDPDDFGELAYVPIDMSRPTAQLGLIGLCEGFRNASFYADPCVKYPGWKNCRIEGEYCPMELLKAWVTTPCDATTDDHSEFSNCQGDSCVAAFAMFPQRATCCGMAFPLSDSAAFSSCSKSLTALIDDYFSSGRDDRGGSLYDSEGSLKAVIYSLPTNKKYNDVFDVLSEFYDELTSITSDFKKSASDVKWVQEVFLDASLEFFDLQRSLSSGAYQSAGLSFAFAFAVLICTTRSPILTTLSILSISAIVCCIVGTLVIDGWQLNILESVIISVAVGLAVDFVAHYCHSYLLSPNKICREIAVTHMFKTMGVSVLTGAITTFIAGFFMVFGKLLFFYQFGFFMMITVGFSWLFTNFFLAPLMAVVGPDDLNASFDFGNMKRPTRCRD